VNRSGGIVREQEFPNGGYDIERLATGDESAGGRSMRALRGADDPVDTPAMREGCETAAGCLEGALTGIAPSLLLHGLLFVLPDWVTPLGGVAVLIQGLVVAVWGGVEVFVRRGRLYRTIR